MLDAPLVCIETPDFSAVVKPMSELPAMKIMNLMTESEAGKQFAIAVALFRDELSSEKLAELDALTMPELTVVITKWVESY
jgi:hypothetical protein